MNEEEETLSLHEQPLDQFVDTREAARVLRVSKDTIKGACKRYKIRMMHVHPKDLDAHSKNREQPAAYLKPAPNELACVWTPGTGNYLVYRPTMTGFLVNRVGDPETAHRRGRKAAQPAAHVNRQVS